MTGLYSVSMNLVSALSAGLSVSIALSPGYDWRFAMQIWGIIPALAVIILLLRLPGIITTRKKVFAKIDARPGKGLLKSKLAWAVTLFMGLQSLIAYSLFAWLLIILTTKGFTESEAGWLMTTYQLALLPIAFLAPIVASKMENQSGLAFLSGMMFFVGLLGVSLISSSYWVVPFLIIIGIGAGTTFSLAMIFFVMRTGTVEQSSQLSAMAQSIGYLIAAAGPLFLGTLSEFANGWAIPLVVLMSVAVMVALLGLYAGRPEKINFEEAN